MRDFMLLVEISPLVLGYLLGALIVVVLSRLDSVRPSRQCVRNNQNFRMETKGRR